MSTRRGASCRGGSASSSRLGGRHGSSNRKLDSPRRRPRKVLPVDQRGAHLLVAGHGVGVVAGQVDDRAGLAQLLVHRQRVLEDLVREGVGVAGRQRRAAGSAVAVTGLLAGSEVEDEAVVEGAGDADVHAVAGRALVVVEQRVAVVRPAGEHRRLAGAARALAARGQHLDPAPRRPPRAPRRRAAPRRSGRSGRARRRTPYSRAGARQLVGDEALGAQAVRRPAGARRVDRGEQRRRGRSSRPGCRRAARRGRRRGRAAPARPAGRPARGRRSRRARSRKAIEARRRPP